MKNYKEIHIWNLPISKLYVQLDETRKDLINMSIEKAENIISGKVRRKAEKLVRLLNDKASKYNHKNIKSSRIVFHWRKGDCFIPLWVVIEMSKLLDKPSLSLENIEKSITYYKGKSQSNIIKANFPLIINHEMVALYFHLFADGCFSESKSTARYCQLDKQNRANFIQKLKNAFGEFDSGKLGWSKYILEFPSIFAFMLKHIFGANTFLSAEGRIPNKIKELPYLLKFSGAIAFLIDEGHISDNINFSSSNKLFLKDFQELMSSIGYESEVSQNILRIKSRCVSKFYEDYLKVISLSPCCNLAYKEDYLKILVNINRSLNGSYAFSKQEIIYFKDKIVKILSGKSLKTNEIRRTLFKQNNISISYTATFKLLKEMEQEQIIIKDRIKENLYIWSLIKNNLSLILQNCLI